MKKSFEKLILKKANFGYAQYTAIINNENEIVDYRFININRAFENIIGLRSDQVIGKTVIEVLPSFKNSSLNFTTYYNEVTLNGGTKEVEQYFKTNDKWYNVQVISLQQGQIATILIDINFQHKCALISKTRAWFGKWNEEECIFGIAKDLSKEQEALEKFNKLFDSNPALMAVSCIKSRKFIDINASFLTVLGYARTEVIGKNMLELDLFVSKDKQQEAAIQIQETGKTENIELEVKKKNGEVLTGLFSGTIIESKGNQYFLTVMIDITERKKIEADLLKSRQQFQLAVDGSNDGIWDWDLLTNSLYLSPKWKAQIGFSDSEFKNEFALFEARIHPEDKQRVLNFAKKYLEGLTSEYSIEFRLQHKDLSYRWILARGKAIRNTQGKAVRMAGSHTDITERKNAEIKLRKLSMAVEQSPAAILITNLTGDIEYVNPKYIKTTGYSFEEARKQNLIVSEFSVHQPKEQEELIKTIIAEKGWNGEYQNKKKNGDLYWTSTSIAPITDENNKTINLIAIKEDITERKALEKDIILQNNLRKVLVEIATEFINIPPEEMDFSIHEALKKIGMFVNADRSYVFDYNWDDEIARNTHEWCNEDIPAEIDNLQNIPFCQMEEWVRQHKNGNTMYVPDVNALPNGQSRDILESQGIKSFITVPMLINNLCVGMVGLDSVKKHHNYSTTEQLLLHVFAQVLANVITRKKMIADLISAKQQIEENEKKLIVSQSIAKLGGWEFSIDKNVFIFNDNFYSIFHTNEKEIGGYELSPEKYASTFLLPGGISKVSKELRNALSSSNDKSEFYLEDQFNYRDGSLGYLAVKYFIEKDKTGKTVKLYGINQDITERKLLELDLIAAKEKAEESSKLKTAFIKNISHEIRTPLNGILGFADFMIDETLSLEEKLDHYSILQLSTNRLLQTITDIMDISQLHSGTITPRIKAINALDIINIQLEKIRSSCKRKNIELINQTPLNYKQLLFFTDEELFSKILFHLLSNAEKFTSNGMITLGYEVLDVKVRFFVKDTGKGIEEDILHSIFEPFYQGDVSNSRSYEGSGLGLSIVKGIIDLLEGKIWIKTKLGEGTTFFFDLPLQKSPTKEDVSIVRDKTKSKNEKPLILIAEDDEMNFQYLKLLLIHINCNYLHARNGREAINLCQQHPNIDIILMDITMPLMNGIEALHQIREFNPLIPIIATTAHAQTSDKNSLFKAGFNDYIEKPIYKNNLINLLKKYIAISN